MSLIKLSNGVGISEETVVAALEKAGIETTPKPKKSKFGDIVELKNSRNRRIVLYNEDGELCAFNVDGDKVGGANNNIYCQTNQNIFTNNLLNLNN